MSMNLFLPSLAHMADDFGVSYGVIQLSVGLYLALTGAAQIVLGPLADRIGRRPVLLGAFGIYVIASIGCALATGVVVFLACRMLQAVVYSAVVLARTIVRDTMPEGRAAATIGYVTMGMAMVPMVSPTLGGLLEAGPGWRSGFWLMAAMGGVAFLLVHFRVRETRRAGHASLRAQLAEYPDLLTDRRFWAYTVAMATSAGCYFAYLGGAPYLGREVFGLSPVTLGILFGATSLGYATGSLVSGRLSERRGIRAMIRAGTAVTTAAIALSLCLFLAGAGSAAVFFGLTILVGLGYGMSLPNATAGLMSGTPRLAASASGLGSATMILLGAVISVVAGIATESHGAIGLLALQLALSGAGLVLFRRLIR